MTTTQNNRDIILQPNELEKDMLTKDTHTQIKVLFTKGMAKRAIARFVGIDIKTVRTHLKKSGWHPYSRPPSLETVLSPYSRWLSKRIHEVDYNASVLYRELCHQGYQGSYDTVKTFVSPHRVRHLEKACVRFETPPGKQSQVDWGSAWTWFGLKRVKVHIFAMVLGYSRRLFGQAYLNEKQSSLIHAHEMAFEWFGGMTEHILYDNPKTMVISHDIGTGEVILNTRFKDFVNYYGFKSRFCCPYRPQTKGKIESGVKYIKGNFLKGRRFEDLDHFNRELKQWCLETADERIHGTTHEQPVERFKKENLIPVTRTSPYVFYPAISRKVSREARVRLNTNAYSLPWQYACQCVDLKVCGNELHIISNGDLITTHLLLHGKNQESIHKSHYAGLLKYQQSLTAQEEVPPSQDPYWKSEMEVQVRDLSIYEQVSQSSNVVGGSHAA